MASPKKGPTVGGLLRELVVVFIGVLLALAADDVRETREERREARQSLALMVLDLRADSLEYAQARRTNQGWAEAADWVAARWDQPNVSRDSAASVISDFTRLTTLELSIAGFDGLRSANRIRVIPGDSVRAMILGYYQTNQPRTVLLRDAILEQRWALHMEGLPRYVQNLLGPGARDAPRLRLRTPWSELTADHQLHSQVVWFGRTTSAFARRMAEAEQLAGEMIAKIELAVGEM